MNNIHASQMLLKYFLWNDGVCIDNEERGSKRSLKGDNH